MPFKIQNYSLVKQFLFEGGRKANVVFYGERGIHVNEVMPLRILFLVVKAKGQIASSDIQPVP